MNCTVIYCNEQNTGTVTLQIFSFCMTVQNPKLPLQSLDELSKSEEYSPLVMFGTVHHTLLEVDIAVKSSLLQSTLFVVFGQLNW